LLTDGEENGGRELNSSISLATSIDFQSNRTSCRCQNIQLINEADDVLGATRGMDRVGPTSPKCLVVLAHLKVARKFDPLNCI